MSDEYCELSAKEIESDWRCGSSSFEFPDCPLSIPEWAEKEAEDWRGKDRFELEVLAEERSGKTVEIRKADLPEGVWGFHVARGRRARLVVNSRLPDIWQRFALCHEIYHLINHSEGEAFWSKTFHPLSRFENEADTFAWAVIRPQWQEGDC